MTRIAIDAAFLERLVPLSALPEPLRDHLAKNSQVSQVAPGEIFFRRGERAEAALWLLEGEVDLLRDGVQMERVQAGSDAARLPLVPARDWDAQARTPVQVLIIERTLVDSCLFWSQSPDESDDPEAEDRSTAWIIRLSGSSLFTRIPPENLRRVFGCMERIQFLAGDTVVRQGQPGDYYYLIETGRCAVTRQMAAGEREVRLAELGPGDSFGEEALVANTRRNATVTMLTDGVLHRLTKESFLDLIKAPLIRSLDLAQARDISRGGGVTWIDVRLPEEHRQSGIKGSRSIPLADLRDAIADLSRERRYLVYCDSGRRSAVGTFLLMERGFDAYHLRGGILGRQGPATPAGAVQSSPEPVARRIEAAAEQAARLHLALTRSHTEVAAAIARHGTADKAFESEAAETARVLEEAQQRRKELAAASAVIQELTAEEMSAALEEESRFKDEAEARLRQGEQRLEQEYARLCGLIEAHQRKREAAVAAMSEARGRIEAEVRDKEHALAALEAQARAATADLQRMRESLAGHQREAEQQYATLLDEERRLRSEGQARLHRERTHLEGEFAGVVALLERIHRARETAADSRRRAEEEGRRLEQEAHNRIARLKAEAEARIAAERQRLEQQAEAVRRQLTQAEAEKERAREALERFQSQAPDSRDTTRPEVAADLARKQAAADQAEAQFAEAEREKARIQESFRAVDQAEAEQDACMASLNQRLAAELEEWVSQELGQEDRAQAVRNQLLEDITRAQEEAERARQAEQEATAMMLAEIEAQLGSGDEKQAPSRGQK